jgi:hypothetical protein
MRPEQPLARPFAPTILFEWHISGLDGLYEFLPLLAHPKRQPRPMERERGRVVIRADEGRPCLRPYGRHRQERALQLFHFRGWCGELELNLGRAGTRPVVAKSGSTLIRDGRYLVNSG